MTYTLFGMFFGIFIVLIYSLLNGIKRKELPNLAVVLFLFFFGPTTDEAIFLLITIKQILLDKEVLQIGVFEGHLYPIGFGAIAMLIGVLYTVVQSFSPIFKSK